jgi:hypothetical protein
VPWLITAELQKAGLLQPIPVAVRGILFVNHDATVYQRNMGKTTAEQAAKVQRFNPDAGWQKVQ